MIKAVLSGSFEFHDAAAAVVPLHKAGVDSGWMRKRAAAQVFDFSEHQPKKGETLVHLLALGDGETVGCNRNGDYFPKAANQKYHPTFMKAHYFHNHDNKDPEKSYGRVVAAAYNGPMGRVELIVGIDNDRGSKDLDELEKKGEFPVSMSCRVPYDVCSICDNKAKNRAEYCKHASAMMGRIMQDGKQACVVNDHPDFFDISKVWRGADRVAFTFRKLEKAAAAGETLGGAELAELLHIVDNELPQIRSAHAVAKQALLEKFAATLAGSLARFGQDELEEMPAEALTMLKACQDRGALFGALHRAGICLSPSAFFELAGLEKGASVKDGDIKKRIRGFLVQADSTQKQRVAENGTYDGTTHAAPQKVAAAIRALQDRHSLLPAYSQMRMLSKVASAGLSELEPFDKAASAASPETEILANEYASYLVSFARAAGDDSAVRGYVQNLTPIRALR